MLLRLVVSSICPPCVRWPVSSACVYVLCSRNLFLYISFILVSYRYLIVNSIHMSGFFCNAYVFYFAPHFTLLIMLLFPYRLSYPSVGTVDMLISIVLVICFEHKRVFMYPHNTPDLCVRTCMLFCMHLYILIAGFVILSAIWRDCLASHGTRHQLASHDGSSYAIHLFLCMF